jgi:hypothetical protein
MTISTLRAGKANLPTPGRLGERNQRQNVTFTLGEVGGPNRV